MPDHEPFIVVTFVRKKLVKSFDRQAIFHVRLDFPTHDAATT
jgi:hypothetical protein